jgi:spoIIIJ-associated protein
MNKNDFIKKNIEDIFNHMGCAISDFSISDDDSMLWISIDTPDSRFIIGKDGDTLRSFNHLLKRMIEKEYGEESSANVFFDVNGYQKKKFDNLKATAYMLAERARYFKSSIEVDPMPASERKIIHMFLENAKDIKTESTGYGPDRKVVIKYTGEISF